MVDDVPPAERAPFELKLSLPPIKEVACGFEFDSLPGLDALQLGRVWAEAFPDYPRAIPQAPIPDAGGLQVHLGAPEIRAWFVSDDDSRVVQLQRDRLIYNWRKVESLGYPRFRTHDGQPGVLDSALAAYEAFVAWCQRQQLDLPSLETLSVTKVDLLERTIHWSTLNELGDWLPALQPILEATRGEPERVELNLATRSANVLQTLTIRAGLVRGQIRQVRLETTASESPGVHRGAERDRLVALNDAVNELFLSHLSPMALRKLGQEDSK